MKNRITFFLILLAFLSLQFCKSVDIGSEPTGKTDTTTFACSGKTQCSEMKSCEEAEYYLKNCPNVEIDGDADGIPCEEQWCGH